MSGQKTQVGHWKQDECDVYVGRGNHGKHMESTPRVGQRGWLGNPYTVDGHGRIKAIGLFRESFQHKLSYDPEFRASVRKLSGKTLGCWCRQVDEDEPDCHADVIAEWADRLAENK